jgi:RHS repeat-associated protein
LETTTESNASFTHTTTLSYDSFGRPVTGTNATQDLTTGLSTAITTKNNYNTYNGIMDKMTDANNNVLWQLNIANEKMKSLTETLGNGVTITNAYNADGYYTSQKHSKNSVNILYNTYDFNAVKGTLNNRQNLVLGTNEAFVYDTLDRLIYWTNPLTNTMDSNGYDARGRITTNNKLGTVNYNTDTNTGIYRKKSITLTTQEAKDYYTNLPKQVVSYTMFKSPISINESDKGSITFVYNSHLSRQTMQYGYDPGTQTYTKTKNYSDDGSVEILKTPTTITIRTYIGGDAYSAPLYIDKIKTIATGAILDKKYYLHRDYLGSIIAISDETGVAVERRQFDAWGNLCKFQQNGVMTPLPSGGAGGGMILDRGYTSHEHLSEVGLIQMNGRLYDPVLRSFLMPDNFIQQPENTQNYNRYAYVLNNPLMYTDPSGEFIPLLAAVAIGAAVGAFAYTMTALLADVPFSVGGLLKASFIGAVTAAVTFGIEQAASCLFSTPAVGFLQGAYQGAVIGAITGVGGAVANAIFSGQDITLKAVLGGAVTGAVIGGVLGGIQGGIRANKAGLSFWKGVGSSTSNIAMPPAMPLSNAQYGNNAEMRADYDTNIGSVDGMNLAEVEDKVGTSVFVGNENNLVPSYKMDSSGYITDSNGQNVPGYTRGFKSKIFGKLYSQTTIAPSLKGYSLDIRNMVFKHEFMHAWHWSSGFNNFDKYTERATSQFSKDYSKAFRFDYTPQETGLFPATYGWRNFNKIVPTWIK